jgi:hypothetical protein
MSHHDTKGKAGGGAGAAPAAKERTSLVDMQSTYGVKDPSEHAKRQVADLDKTAKKSRLKQKMMQEQVESDTRELARIEEQLAGIHKIYDPLVAGLEEKQKKRAELVKLLDQCKVQEQGMMQNMKGMVSENVSRSFKQSRQAASFKLEVERGFTVKPESTFRQSGSSPGRK